MRLGFALLELVLHVGDLPGLTFDAASGALGFEAQLRELLAGGG
jgi:hypothetical protein